MSYRDYYGTEPGGSASLQTTQGGGGEYQSVRQQLYQSSNGHDIATDRYAGNRQGGTGTVIYKNNGATTVNLGLTVDLPSPDSGIGETAVTPRDSTGLPQVTQVGSDTGD